MDREKRYYLVQELAEALRVHPETVRRWIRQGRISYIKMPKGNLIKKEEYKRILENGPGPGSNS